MSSTTSPRRWRRSSTWSPPASSTGKRGCAAAIGEIGELRMGQVIEALNEALGPHMFPDKGDGTDPRVCPTCGTGRLSLKTGKYGAFIGCSNYPECRYTRPIAQENGDEDGGASGDRELG